MVVLCRFNTHPDPVKKVIVFPWPGNIKLFPVTESLVSDIPAGEGKTITFFLQSSGLLNCGRVFKELLLNRLSLTCG